MRKGIAAIGECMAEIRPGREDAEGTMPAAIAYGGDTLNCAVYIARQGLSVDYVTALGDDRLSGWMLSQWRAEGVGCDLVLRAPGAVPGLYLIDVDAAGERSFRYWRRGSPASRLLDDPDQARLLLRQLAGFEWIYLTGITLAIYAPEARARLFAFLRSHRAAGGKVAFDSNFRPRLWADAAEAASVHERMYRMTDLALPTLDDERLVFGQASELEAVRRLRTWGVGEIALKKGPEGCLVAAGDRVAAAPADKVADIVDTTAAGDSFNAGYLAARLTGRSIQDAAVRGNRLAALVVRHPGAIMPRIPLRDALPDLTQAGAC